MGLETNHPHAAPREVNRSSLPGKAATDNDSIGLEFRVVVLPLSSHKVLEFPKRRVEARITVQQRYRNAAKSGIHRKVESAEAVGEVAAGIVVQASVSHLGIPGTWAPRAIPCCTAHCPID